MVIAKWKLCQSKLFWMGLLRNHSWSHTNAFHPSTFLGGGQKYCPKYNFLFNGSGWCPTVPNDEYGPKWVQSIIGLKGYYNGGTGHLVRVDFVRGVDPTYIVMWVGVCDASEARSSKNTAKWMGWVKRTWQEGLNGLGSKKCESAFKNENVTWATWGAKWSGRHGGLKGVCVARGDFVKKLY